MSFQLKYSQIHVILAKDKNVTVLAFVNGSGSCIPSFVKLNQNVVNL